jgi:hypothetical protein
VFHQVKEWIGEADNMEAKDWGWSIENNICVPIRSSLPPAPDELLKKIYCRCKTNCDSKRCNCIFGVKTRDFEEKSLKTGNFTCSLYFAEYYQFL